MSPSCAIHTKGYNKLDPDTNKNTAYWSSDIYDNHQTISLSGKTINNGPNLDLLDEYAELLSITEALEWSCPKVRLNNITDVDPAEKAKKKQIIVYTSSEYVYNVLKYWIYTWRRESFITNGLTLRPNYDLLIRLSELLSLITLTVDFVEVSKNTE